ncbi:hypothetical protein BZG36_05203 [Bifiguratus adelaidae]|uniref:ABC transporter domain-containing protein n=1 Tax=Bifiguratus adelaidae TaxID=1938954 RepID=A0A261XUV3_9FUNG|nr:hypothetical protein BZG36_05203 [Bifiguratus adelaidae]
MPRMQDLLANNVHVQSKGAIDENAQAIEITDLSFDYGGRNPVPILSNVSLTIERGSRVLLVGANGAGKTTLLRILAGKRLVKGSVRVFGHDAFLDAPKGVTYLGTEWAGNPIVKADLSVGYLLQSMGGDRFAERRDRLLEVLEVDVDWHMHQRSDGERRRVQLVMGLMAPWNLLLMDEVTVDLDVLVRSQLLQYLKEETEQRGATILYATHIFDGKCLSQWPTHLAHMADRTVLSCNSTETSPEYNLFKQYHKEQQLLDSPLMSLCIDWLRRDKERLLRARQAQGSERRLSETDKPKTRWDELSEDMKTYGDKYYNYWSGQP